MLRPRIPREALFSLAYRASSVASRLDLTRFGIEVVRVDWDESLALADAAFVALARRSRLLFVQGWLFDARPLLVKHSVLVRKTLAFEKSLLDRCRGRIEPLRGMSEIIVGVHIRHGDYRHFLGGKYHFPIAVYCEQMARFHELVDKSPAEIAFVICSDEAQENSEFEGFRHLYSGARAAEDMCMLSQCDFIFGPPSTFALWASFAGQVPYGMLITPHHQLKVSDFRIAESQMEFPEVEELLA
ncbi:MAG TPA: alpha-1,2-fucosyltransferase [Actinomycetota bacterium]|nr:alpha-1,2-fucosyltransferase [Actinomycetota bacterium]